MPRVLLLLPATTYKASDFLEAGLRVGVDVVVGSDRRQALESAAPGHTLTLRFAGNRALETIRAEHARRPFRAVLGVDDETVILAARASFALGLPHNPADAVRASRDKFESRTRFSAAGLRGPRTRRILLAEGPDAVSGAVDYPCVLKPLFLSAGRGVIRANDAEGFGAAFRRIESILADPDLRGRDGDADHLLVEDYLPGEEVALEGLLVDGRLHVLAILDKPDPLEGPTFEETLFVTPSRKPGTVQRAIEDEVAAGCRALGLREGPVHAELRVHDGVPWLLEVAARSIGGLCSRTLRFGAGTSLEELILRHALGGSLPDRREDAAAGVMMIPIPGRGVLREVSGLETARAVPGVEDVILTMHRGAELVPLPEGHQYLGFIFARGEDPEGVERSLRDAFACLGFSVG